jgi:pimeloyl-ACP methyl ester carboxylesterase
MWSISGDVPKADRFKPIRRGSRFLDSITVPSELPGWLSEQDLSVYVDEFQRTGFRGGLNWYRNADLNWEQSADLGAGTVQQPAMFVTGSRDPARNPAAIERLTTVVPDLRVFETLEGCGHWTQQERPSEVTALMLEFLASVDGDSRTM